MRFDNHSPRRSPVHDLQVSPPLLAALPQSCMDGTWSAARQCRSDGPHRPLPGRAERQTVRAELCSSPQALAHRGYHAAAVDARPSPRAAPPVKSPDFRWCSFLPLTEVYVETQNPVLIAHRNYGEVALDVVLHLDHLLRL